MKKLMFALVAGVAATVATAASITQSGFETAEGFTVGSNPTNNASARFSYVSTSSSEDGSTVKAYTAEGMEKKSVSYDNNEFSGVGDNYLDLNTDGGTLYRSINDIPLNAPYGTERTVTSSLYIDTLVRFTVCDSAPEIDSGAKLAIWLQASDDETTTNLMVKAKQWTVVDEDGQVVATTATSTNRVYTLANLNNTPYAADHWYRLTVEDLGNVFTASGRGATGFKILIDGQAVGAVSGSAFVTTGDADATSVLTGKVGDVAGLTDGSVFMSMADDNIVAATYTSSLCAVGFSGTGAVDNIMFTEENPFFVAPTAIDFTIALSNVGSVGYSFTTNGYNETGSFTATGGTLEDLPPGTAVTLTPTAKTDELGWNIYGAPVVENAVNADIDTTEGIVVTLASTFTQGMGDTARVEVNASETPVAKDNAAFSGAQWSTPAENLTDEQFAALVAWAGARGYSTSRVANYPYALERMALTGHEDGNPGFPIEMPVYVATNELVAGYASTVVGELDGESGDVKYVVDAGLPLTFSDFTYETPPANKAYKLDGNTSSVYWDYNPDDGNVETEGFTSIVVDPVTSNSVVLTTSYAAAYAQVKIGVVAVSTAPTTYDFTVTFGATISGVSYVIGEGESTAASNGQTIVVPVGDTITFTPVAAGGLLQPAVKAVTDNGATTNAVNTTYAAAAAGAVEFFAEATAYGVTVTFGAGVTGAQYAITPDGASGSAADATQIAVPNGKTITFTPAASGLALPLFYTLADAGATTNYFATKEYTAAAADTFYAIAAAQAPGDDAAVETATKNAIADAATVAEGAAVAAAVETKLEALDAAGISATEVAAWKTATASAVTYEAFANNANVAESIKLDTAVLFNKEPEAVVSAAEEGSVAGKYELTFTITDGQNTATPANTDAVKAYVESLVQMTSDLSDWTVGAGKPGIAPTVDVTVDGSTLKATVNKPAGESTVFMKIGK